MPHRMDDFLLIFRIVAFYYTIHFKKKKKSKIQETLVEGAGKLTIAQEELLEKNRNLTGQLCGNLFSVNMK